MTYTYDDAGQVTGADRAVNDDAFAYDDNGNRVGSQESFGDDALSGSTAGTNNQLTGNDKYGYSYDDEGNRASRWERDSNGDPAGKVTYYAWDHRNQLTGLTTYTINSVVGGEIVTGALLTTVEFVYDVNGNSIERVLGGNRHMFIYDGLNLLSEWDDSGEAVGDWVHGPGTDDVLFQFEQETPFAHILLADHLHTVRDVVTTVDISEEYNGWYVSQNLEHTVYDSFGVVAERWTRSNDEEIWSKSYRASLTASITPMGYTGKYQEETLGLARHGRRFYEAGTGKWLSEDPIGFAGGTDNLSEYVGNASVNRVDPNGLKETTILDVTTPANWTVRNRISYDSDANAYIHSIYAISNWETVDTYQRTLTYHNEAISYYLDDAGCKRWQISDLAVKLDIAISKRQHFSLKQIVIGTNDLDNEATRAQVLGHLSTFASIVVPESKVISYIGTQVGLYAFTIDATKPFTTRISVSRQEESWDEYYVTIRPAMQTLGFVNPREINEPTFAQHHILTPNTYYESKGFSKNPPDIRAYTYPTSQSLQTFTYDTYYKSAVRGWETSSYKRVDIN